jgi:hypothetical protein
VPQCARLPPSGARIGARVIAGGVRARARLVRAQVPPYCARVNVEPGGDLGRGAVRVPATEPRDLAGRSVDGSPFRTGPWWLYRLFLVAGVLDVTSGLFALTRHQIGLAIGNFVSGCCLTCLGVLRWRERGAGRRDGERIRNAGQGR